jgi:hypothetical protein
MIDLCLLEQLEELADIVLHAVEQHVASSESGFISALNVFLL